MQNMVPVTLKELYERTMKGTLKVGDGYALAGKILTLKKDENGVLLGQFKDWSGAIERHNPEDDYAWLHDPWIYLIIPDDLVESAYDSFRKNVRNLITEILIEEVSKDRIIKARVTEMNVDPADAS